MTRLILLSLSIILLQFSGTKGQSQFRDHPASTTVLTNFPATLSCTSLPPPSLISWEKDGSLLDTGDGRLEVTMDSASGRSQLRISTVYYADSGQYLCTAFNEFGDILDVSQPATLTVHGLPEVSLPPVSAVAGSTAVLTCQVLSIPAATTITWAYQQDGISRPITSSGRFITSGRSLTILNAQETDTGYYICSAQNAFGTNSTSGRLTVRMQPSPLQVTITPSNLNPYPVREGSTVTFRCSVPPETAVSSISWTLDSGDAVMGVTQVTNGLLLTITGDSKDSGNVYTCSVMDASGANSSQSIEVTITVPPSFTVEPDNIVGAVGQSVTTPPICTAEGDPSPTISWLRPDLTPLPTDSVTLAPDFGVLTRRDTGVYTCLAANSAGEIRSQFTLTVQGPPLVQVSPLSVTVPPGENITLQCTVDSTPEATVVWSRVDNAPLPGHSVGTDRVLHLFAVSSSATGMYLCTASNLLGTAFMQAQVNVLATPRITSTSPSPVTVQAGSPLILTCTRSGPPEASLVWYFNGTRLDPTTDRNIQVGVTGTLTVTTTTISNTGTYTCNVSTFYAVALAHIQVLVGESPSIIASPSDTDLLPGMSTLLSCQARGFPSPHSTWFRTDILSGQRVELGIIGPTYTQLSHGLRLVDVRGNDTGMYECQVENAFGRSVQRAVVRVEGSPVAVSIQPTVLSMNTTATLTCTIPLNFPQGTVAWTRPAGTPLPSDRFAVSSSGELVISQVEVGDAGEVVCTVTNQYGNSSVSQAIRVLFPPTVTVTPPTSSVILEGSVVLSCDVEADPAATIQWTGPPGANAAVDRVTGQLTISNAGAENNGEYVCTGTNSLGSASAMATVTVQGEGVPGLSATDVTTNSMNVRWNDLSPDAQNILQNYVLELRRAGREDIELERSVPFFTRTFPLSNLLPGVMYEITLRGVFVDDITGIDATIIATTGEEAPSGPPLNLQATPIENGVFLRWMLPAEEVRNGVIIGHTLEYRPTDEGNPEAPYTPVDVPSQNQSETSSITYVLRDLGGGSSYDVRVVAMTAVGVGPPSDPVVVVTLQGRLIGPATVSIVAAVGVCLLVLELVGAVVLGAYVIFLLHKRRTRAGKHDPLLAEEKGRKAEGKPRKKKKTVSGPIPGITPAIDNSVQGKFTVQGQNGNVIELKPKVITSKDVAPVPGKGQKVKVVGRESTVLARSGDESDEGRIDPYDSPADALEQSGVQRRQKTSSPIQVRGKVESGVYSEVSDSIKTQREDEGEEEGEGEDKPYEDVEYDQDEEEDEQEEEDKEEGQEGSEDGGTDDDTPLHPEGPDNGTEDSNLLYSSISQTHIEAKRERRLQEEQRQKEEQQKKQAQQQRLAQQRAQQQRLAQQRVQQQRLAQQGQPLTQQQQQQQLLAQQRAQMMRMAQLQQQKMAQLQGESKEQRKMREKMERERIKQAEKQKKQAEKERKRQEAEQKKREKEQKKRESMGLSNIVSYQDIDFSKPGAKAQAAFIDSATAAMF